MTQLTDWFLGSYASIQQLPFVLLGLLFLLLIVIAYFRRVYPSPLLVGLMLVPLALTLLLLAKSDLIVFVLTVDFALLLVALADVVSFARPITLTVERQCQRIASLQKAHDVQLTITNNGARPQKAEIRDDIPQEFIADPDRFVGTLEPRSRSTFRYQLESSRRGAFQLDQVYLKLRSHLGLWDTYRDYPVKNDISVYPDMQQLSKYAVLARTNRLSLMGFVAHVELGKTTNSSDCATTRQTTTTSTSIGAVPHGVTSSRSRTFKRARVSV